MTSPQVATNYIIIWLPGSGLDIMPCKDMTIISLWVRNTADIPLWRVEEVQLMSHTHELHPKN